MTCQDDKRSNNVFASFTFIDDDDDDDDDDAWVRLEAVHLELVLAADANLGQELAHIVSLISLASQYIRSSI